MPQDLIIDCDTGSDDAIALLVGALHPDLNLVAVTTVAGNCPVDVTTLNTLKVLDSARISGVPVYRGAEGPLVGPPIDRSAGWPQDLDLPEPSIAAEPVHAVDFLVEKLAAAETPITVAAVGPLTNLALAFRMRPRIVSRIERLAIMGGGIAVTNISASAEANIFWDAEAADVVFRAGAPIDLYPLDATHMAPVTSGDVARWAESGTPAALTAAAFLPERIHMYESRMPWHLSPRTNIWPLRRICRRSKHSAPGSACRGRTAKAVSCRIPTSTPVPRTARQFWCARQKRCKRHLMRRGNHGTGT